MTIKFICSCGKHLKARDELARRRSVCPRCGSPVGIPSLAQRQAGPATPLPRAHTAAETAAASAATATLPVDARVVRLLSLRSQRPPRSGRHLEAHWHQCLLYPVRAWPLCAAMAMVMMALTAGVAMFLPSLLAEPPTDPWTRLGVRVSWSLLVVLTVGVPASFFDRVLVSAAMGEIDYIQWSGSVLLTVALSGMRWLACFFTGPVVFAVIAYLYWLNSGDTEIIDWLILAQLGIVAVAYQAFVLLSLTDRGRLRDLNPLAVADLAHRLGGRAMGVVLVAAAVFLVHGAAILGGVLLIHRDALLGCAILAIGWASGVFWGTFFCRLLGIWCFRSRPGVPPPVPAGTG